MQRANGTFAMCSAFLRSLVGVKNTGDRHPFADGNLDKWKCIEKGVPGQRIRDKEPEKAAAELISMQRDAV